MEKIVLTNTEELYNNFEEFLSGGARGIIELAVPVANINEWYDVPSSMLEVYTGLDRADLERVIYYSGYYVDGQVLSEIEMQERMKELPNEESRALALNPPMGISAFSSLRDRDADLFFGKKIVGLRKEERRMMGELDHLREIIGDGPLEAYMEGEPHEVTEEEKTVAEAMKEAGSIRADLFRTRKALDSCIKYKTQGADRLFIEKIRLFPMRLRTLLREQSNVEPYAVMHNLEVLCERVILRNERLKRLVGIHAPAIVIRNERRQLQEAVDALLANGKRGEPVTDASGIPLASIGDVVVRKIEMF